MKVWRICWRHWGSGSESTVVVAEGNVITVAGQGVAAELLRPGRRRHRAEAALHDQCRCVTSTALEVLVRQGLDRPRLAL